MSRQPLQTVTLPILVSAASEYAEGCWTAEIDGWVTTKNARVIPPPEIERRLPEILRRKDLDMLKALDALDRAYESADSWGLREAIHKVCPFLPTIRGEVVTLELADKNLRGLARLFYSQLMSTALQHARVVMWFTTEGPRPFSPAIYCPDLRTAVFAMRWAGGIRICPKCEKPFVPGQDNIGYCTPAHGVAYRTARSRAKKKRAAEEQARKKSRKLVG
jgi:hypothetical protein